VTFTAWIAHEQGRQLLGPVPDGVDVAVVGALDELPATLAGVRFWSPPFLADGGEKTLDLVARLPDLEVIQLMTAGAEAWIGRIPPSVTLCDGRGIHDSSTSEWAVAAILSYLRGFPMYARNQAEGRWDRGRAIVTDELAGKRVLIVGAGAIGTATAARLAPFDVTITLVARAARAGVCGVEDLPKLLPFADVVVLLVPLTTDTRGMVDAAFLAAMPDGALLVNAARGPIVQTDALVVEVQSGRLHAALDVTDPEPLPAGHPLWACENVLITPHVAGSVRGLLPRAYRLVGAQLRRFATGAPLENVVAGEY
jgi:phosphoglycerate dehydrogenase-like enzyme